MSGSNKDIYERASYWSTASVFSKTTRDEIKELLTANNNSEIIDRFYRDLEFGTGGHAWSHGERNCKNECL